MFCSIPREYDKRLRVNEIVSAIANNIKAYESTIFDGNNFE